MSIQTQWTRHFLHLSITAGISFGLLAVLLFAEAQGMTPGSLTVILFLTGSVGAVVSNYRRLSRLSSESAPPLVDRMITAQLYVSPVMGGVFALLLWILFIGGLVQGALFPTIDVDARPFTTFHDFMARISLSYSQVAKAVFWCFLAGYSERFIPNILDRLAEENQKNTPGEGAPSPRESGSSAGREASLT